MHIKDQFLKLLVCSEGITEWQQIGIFTAGLRNPKRINVEMQKPKTFEDTMALAWAFEWCLQIDDTSSCVMVP